MKKKLLLAPAVTLPLLYPILQFSISGYGTPVFPMISKIRPSMPAQTMFDIILTSFCSLPATHWGIYPLGLIWRHYRWEQYGGSVDYVRCILLYSFWMVALWMCCCGCMYFIGAICVVSSCWDSTSTSFLAKSSCSPWQPFRKINKDRALYVFLLHFPCCSGADLHGRKRRFLMLHLLSQHLPICFLAAATRTHQPGA